MKDKIITILHWGYNLFQWPKQPAIQTITYPISFSQYVWSFVVGIEGKSRQNSSTTEISSVTLSTSYLWNVSINGSQFNMSTWMLILGI